MLCKLSFPMKLFEIKMKHVYLDFKVTLYVSSEKGKLYYQCVTVFTKRGGEQYLFKVAL